MEYLRAGCLGVHRHSWEQYFSNPKQSLSNSPKNNIAKTFYFYTYESMKLDKFLWSKTKVDILKYLLFRRQGISIRALDHEIPWTFPAIKKQVDSLEEAEVVVIDKDPAKRSISIHPTAAPYIKSLLLYTLETEVKVLFEAYTYMVERYFLWHVFGRDLELDLVVIHKNCEKQILEAMKDAITQLFKNYFIDVVHVAFMSSDEYQRRYRLADKFVLQLMRAEGGK